MAQSGSKCPKCEGRVTRYIDYVRDDIFLEKITVTKCQICGWRPNESTITIQEMLRDFRCKRCGYVDEFIIDGLCADCKLRGLRGFPVEEYTCDRCSEDVEFVSHGICLKCILEEREELRDKKHICRGCGLDEKIHANGMCKICYDRERHRGLKMKKAMEMKSGTGGKAPEQDHSLPTENSSVTITFDGDDAEILEQIKIAAAKNRRTVGNEILLRLETE